MADIHKTAIVSSDVQLGANVKIGPFTIIEGNVIIGDGTQIDAHVLIGKNTTIGKDCRVFHSAVVGEIPQDLKFGKEETCTIVGDRTKIREFVTIHRGTDNRCKTVIGSDCLLMVYVHVAHDVIVGNNVILANNVTLAGHVSVGDFAIIGGLTAVHQFVNIGAHIMIQGLSKVSKDVPPYIMAAGEPFRYNKLNSIGLRRRGFSRETLKAIKEAYKLIYNSEMNVSDAILELEKAENIPEVKSIVDFIKASERGIIR